ncbi:MAG: hypothetical protein ACF8XB_14390 [Planctomycetota bacterium JB042]
MHRAPPPRLPFSGPLCCALALPGAAGFVAWFVLPGRLEGAGEQAGVLAMPFLLALAATSFAAATIALPLGAPRRALAVNLALNLGFPLFLLLAVVVRGGL